MSSLGDFESRYQVLHYGQVRRLNQVMDETIPVSGRGNFPTLQVRLKDLVKAVKKQLHTEGIPLADIRINGGAASYIVDTNCDSLPYAYNDLDLIFQVKISSPSDLQKIKDAALDSLLAFLPEGVSINKMSSCSMKEAYVRKMVKIYNGTDRWSLISLANAKGRNVELKFVDSMKRQFEFSVDSFQIILDSLLTFDDLSITSMTENFYPTVVAESVFGNFNKALFHLHNKLIATRNPEEIRGGGLLKYCHLLVRGFQVSQELDVSILERYMCSRFFIDFSDITQQKPKLESYLENHFNGDTDLKSSYLMTLYHVVDASTICLMGHERRQTLTLIQQFAYQIHYEQQCRTRKKYLEMQYFDQPNNLVVDQVYFGPYNQPYNQYYLPARSGPYSTPFSGNYSPYIQCT